MEEKAEAIRRTVIQHGLMMTAHADVEAREEERRMKCDLYEGEYHGKTVVRNYKWRGKTIIIEDVPALVCDRCGDTLIREETIAAIDELLQKEAQPQEYAPVYRFPTKVA